MESTRSAGARSAPEPVRFPAGDSFVAGHLYRPDRPGPGGRSPAVVVGGSLTAVKEQMGGTYAAALAARGYLAVAIDYRHYGESGGRARQLEDPETKAQDLVAALDWLAARPDVAPDRLAALGVCTSGGTVLYAAARDPRLRAVACVASHLAEPAITPALYGGSEGVARRRAAADAARAAYERTGETALILAYSDVDPTASHVGPMEYYMDRARGGGVPQWRNAFAVMGWAPWLDFDPVGQAARVAAPTLLVHGDDCALPDQARKVHRLLAGPKALHWATGPHFDFYDRPAKVRESTDAAAAHFAEHLAA